jgi:hypothetical protein
MKPAVAFMIFVFILLIVVLVYYFKIRGRHSSSKQNSSSNQELSPEEKNQAESLSKAIPPVSEKFRFLKKRQTTDPEMDEAPQPPPDMTLNDPIACYISSNKEYEKNLIETILNLLTSDSYYNQFKLPLPDVKEFFIKLQELYNKIKSENGQNVNYTAFIFYISKFYTYFIRRVMILDYLKPNVNLTDFYTTIVFWLLMLNYKFILHPKNTNRKFVFAYDKNTNKVIMDIDFVKNMDYQRSKEMGQSDEEIQQDFDEDFPPTLPYSGGSPSEWTNSLLNHLTKEISVSDQEQIKLMPNEIKQKQINDNYKPGVGWFIELQERLNSPDYAKMYNSNYSGKPCRNEF